MTLSTRPKPSGKISWSMNSLPVKTTLSTPRSAPMEAATPGWILVLAKWLETFRMDFTQYWCSSKWRGKRLVSSKRWRSSFAMALSFFSRKLAGGSCTAWQDGGPKPALGASREQKAVNTWWHRTLGMTVKLIGSHTLTQTTNGLLHLSLHNRNQRRGTAAYAWIASASQRILRRVLWL